MARSKRNHRAKLKKKICHCTPQCGQPLVYRSRHRHYHALSSAERLLRRDSESPIEGSSDAGLTTDIEMEAGAGVDTSSSELLMSYSSHGAEGESDGDDASMASEESFPNDDIWNQYDEDEELDAEGRFRNFEELLDSESDIGDERKLQFTSTATTTNKFQVRN